MTDHDQLKYQLLGGKLVRKGVCMEYGSVRYLLRLKLYFKGKNKQKSLVCSISV